MRTPGMSYTSPVSGRTHLLFGCAKRGCDKINADYEAFGTSRHNYCLAHIPWRVRLLMVLTGMLDRYAQHLRQTEISTPDPDPDDDEDDDE